MLMCRNPKGNVQINATANRFRRDPGSLEEEEEAWFFDDIDDENQKGYMPAYDLTEAPSTSLPYPIVPASNAGMPTFGVSTQLSERSYVGTPRPYQSSSSILPKAAESDPLKLSKGVSRLSLLMVAT